MAEVTIEQEDSVIISDTHNIQMGMNIFVNDIVFTQDTNTLNRSVQLSIDETVKPQDLVSFNLAYSIAVTDETKIYDEIITQVQKDDRIIYKTDTWVLNLDNYAFSRYENFYFNSYLQVSKEHLLGTNDNGLFLINDNIKKDDGECISSKIVTKNYQFADTLSYVRDAFIYHNGKGELFLHIKNDNGFDENYMFVGNGQQQQQKLHLNKGNRSIKWQFSIVNEGFGSIDLDKIIVFPLITTRFR